MERRQPAVQLWTKSFRCVFSKKSIEECVCQPLPTHDVQLEEELFISSQQIAQHQSLCAACSSAWRILPHALCKPQTLVALGVIGATIPMALLSLWEAEAHGWVQQEIQHHPAQHQSLGCHKKPPSMVGIPAASPALAQATTLSSTNSPYSPPKNITDMEGKT